MLPPQRTPFEIISPAFLSESAVFECHQWQFLRLMHQTICSKAKHDSDNFYLQCSAHFVRTWLETSSSKYCNQHHPLPYCPFRFTQDQHRVPLSFLLSLPSPSTLAHKKNQPGSVYAPIMYQHLSSMTFSCIVNWCQCALSLYSRPRAMHQLVVQPCKRCSQ
jgi:hypothetical protein